MLAGLVYNVATEVPVTIEEAFGLVIRRLRKERGLSQEKLSLYSSLDRAFISKLESGKQQPTLVTIFELANALRVPAARIMTELELLLDINNAKPFCVDMDMISIRHKGFEPAAVGQELGLTGTETILVVDDESILRKMLADFLEECGYAVIEAVDGQDAVDKFRANAAEIQLVLMDVVMPRRDGLSACKEILDSRPDLPALLMSAYSPGTLGALDGYNFIHKPMSPFDLAKRIRCLLDGTPIAC